MIPRLIIAGALVFVWERRINFAKALIIPFVLYCALDLAKLFDLGRWAWLLLPVALAVQTVFAVTTHRLILLGPDSVPEWGVRTWTKRETFFALHFVLLGVCMLPAGLFNLIPGGWLFSVPLACWLLGRLSLVFPGIAVDKALTFPYSWKLTKNHQLSMVVVVAIFPLMFSIPIALLSQLPYSEVMLNALGTAMTVFTIAALSLAYREITRIEARS